MYLYMIYINKINFDKKITYDKPVPCYIESDNLILKGPLHEHWNLGNFHRFQTSYCGDEMAKYNLYIEPTSLKYTRDNMYKYMIEQWNEMEDMYYVIEEKQERSNYNYDYIGVIGLNFEWDKKYAEFGIWLHKDVWGNEYFAQSFESMCEAIFNHPLDLGIELISAVPSSNNKNSIRAIEKIMNELNGQLDGVIRNYEFFDGIGVDDCHRFSISEDEFKNRY